MHSRRGKNMTQTVFIVFVIICFGYGCFIHYQLRNTLEDARARSTQYQQQQESLTAQLQVVYEHRSRLEKILQKEKSDHKRTKEDHEIDIGKLKQESLNKYNSLNAQHKMLKSRHDEIQAEFDTHKFEHQNLLGDNERLKFEHQQNVSELKAEISNLQENVQELQKDNEKVRNINNQANQQIQAVQSQAQYHKNERDRAVEIQTDTQQKLLAQQQENYRVKYQMQELNEKNNQLQKQVVQLSKLNPNAVLPQGHQQGKQLDTVQQRFGLQGQNLGQGQQMGQQIGLQRQGQIGQYGQQLGQTNANAQQDFKIQYENFKMQQAMQKNNVGQVGQQNNMQRFGMQGQQVLIQGKDEAAEVPGNQQANQENEDAAEKRVIETGSEVEGKYKHKEEDEETDEDEKERERVRMEKEKRRFELEREKEEQRALAEENQDENEGNQDGNGEDQGIDDNIRGGNEENQDKNGYDENKIINENNQDYEGDKDEDYRQQRLEHMRLQKELEEKEIANAGEDEGEEDKGNVRQPDANVINGNQQDEEGGETQQKVEEYKKRLAEREAKIRERDEQRQREKEREENLMAAERARQVMLAQGLAPEEADKKVAEMYPNMYQEIDGNRREEGDERESKAANGGDGGEDSDDDPGNQHNLALQDRRKAADQQIAIQPQQGDEEDHEDEDDDEENEDEDYNEKLQQQRERHLQEQEQQKQEMFQAEEQGEHADEEFEHQRLRAFKKQDGDNANEELQGDMPNNDETNNNNNNNNEYREREEADFDAGQEDEDEKD